MLSCSRDRLLRGPRGQAQRGRNTTKKDRGLNWTELEPEHPDPGPVAPGICPITQQMLPSILAIRLFFPGNRFQRMAVIRVAVNRELSRTS